MKPISTFVVAMTTFAAFAYCDSAKAIDTNDACLESLIMPKCMNLPSHSALPPRITIGSKAEDVRITSPDDCPWFGIPGGEAIVTSGDMQEVMLWAEPNFSAKERKTTLSVTGISSGHSTDVEITQRPYFTIITDGFPARLETQTFSSDKWVSEGICFPEDSPAVLTVVGVNGKKLDYTLKNGAQVANTDVGDYFLYAVPVKKAEAGEQFDFMCTIAGTQQTSPQYFIFEYWDNGCWNSVEGDLRTAEDDTSIQYSFYNKYFSSAHHTTYIQSFTLSQPIVDDCVKVRMRILSPGDGITKFSASGRYMSLYLVRHADAPPVSDRRKILFVGNSFTYYFAPYFMMKEIARSQGHQIDAIVSVKGSQEFSEHLQLERTQEAIKRGGFDYAFLQDTSPNPAIYAESRDADILDACSQINALTLEYSPNCKIIYEQTWACPKNNYRGYGSYERLDYLLEQGSQLLRQDLNNAVEISPIGVGFKLGREQGLQMLHTDNHHQSRVGAYMKACINYLLIYKTRFTESVSDCGVEAYTAQKVRAIAEQVVFGHETVKQASKKHVIEL